jgi:hypothetical protein
MSTSQNFLNATELYSEHSHLIERDWSLIEQGIFHYFSHSIMQHSDALISLSTEDLIKQKQQVFSNILTPKALEVVVSQDALVFEQFIFLLY